MKALIELVKNGYYFKKNFCNKSEFFSFADEFLHSKKVVDDRFLEMITNREEQYPTGLVTMTIPVAIPHTDFEHVYKDSILICSFDESVPFRRMDNPDEEIKVELAIMLLINKKEKHMDTLVDLMKLLQSPSLVKLKNAGTLEGCLKILEEDVK